MNIQGINPSLRSKSSWKLQNLTDKVNKLKDNKTPVSFIALVETWLKSHISDAQLNINDYNIFRSDRCLSKNGGVLLYIHNSIIIDCFSCYDDDFCSAVVCLSTTSNCVIACLYRPPGCSKESFSNTLNFISEFINSNNNLNKLQCFLFGDFNFPQLCWKNSQITSYVSLSSIELEKFTNNHFLSQYIHESTR